jgi:hypothetical protein
MPVNVDNASRELVMQYKSFDVLDSKGKKYGINCSRSYDYGSGQWSYWDCYTSDGRIITPTNLANGEFTILDITPIPVSSIDPNPLK